MRLSGSPLGLSLCIFPPDSHPTSPCAQVLTAGPSFSSQSARVPGLPLCQHLPSQPGYSCSVQPARLLARVHSAERALAQSELYPHWPIGGATWESWELLLVPSAYRGKPVWSRQCDYVLIKRQWGCGVPPTHPASPPKHHTAGTWQALAESPLYTGKPRSSPTPFPS